MGWLWQLGARWLGSQVMSQATQAATSEVVRQVAGDQSGGHQVSMAVFCNSKLMFDAVADHLSGRKQFQADRIVIEQGSLGGTAVVVARPLDDSIDPLRLVTAVVDGHAPQFALSLAEAASLDAKLTPGTLVLANRVIDRTGKPVRLEVTPPAENGYVAGTVLDASIDAIDGLTTEGDVPLAEDAWSAEAVRGCQAAELPVVVVAAVVDPPREARSSAVAAVNKKRSLASRAGVLTGMLLNKPSGFKELWNAKEARWEAASRIAHLAKGLAASCQAEPEADA